MKKKTTKKKVKLPQPYDAIRNYLEKNGWKVLVIGGTNVEQRDFGRKFNFTFTCQFTGAKKNLDA